MSQILAESGGTLLNSYITRRMNEIRRAIRSWLTTVGGDEVLVIDEGQMRGNPDQPFLTLKFLGSLRMIGARDLVMWSPSDNCFIKHGHREATISIKAVGRAVSDQYSTLIRATDMLEAVRFTLQDPTSKGVFEQIGLVIIGDEGIIDTTQQDATTFPPRASMDVGIRFAIKEAVEMETIERVEISGELTTDRETEVPIEQFTVSREGIDADEDDD